jgi:hypothetical protein
MSVKERRLRNVEVSTPTYRVTYPQTVSTQRLDSLGYLYILSLLIIIITLGIFFAVSTLNINSTASTIILNSQYNKMQLEYEGQPN